MLTEVNDTTRLISVISAWIRGVLCPTGWTSKVTSGNVGLRERRNCCISFDNSRRSFEWQVCSCIFSFRLAFDLYPLQVSSRRCVIKCEKPTVMPFNLFASSLSTRPSLLRILNVLMILVLMARHLVTAAYEIDKRLAEGVWSPRRVCQYLKMRDQCVLPTECSSCMSECSTLDTEELV